MAKYDYDVIVVGGGAAGITSSIWSASLGSKTLLIEKEEKLGGDCLHYGCVPSKSLIKSAYVNHLLGKTEEYGLPKIDRPKVDFAKVRDRIQNIIASIQVHDSPEFFKEQYKIDTEFGLPKFKNANTIEINGKTFTSAKFIMATGSSARIPDIEGLKDVPYLTNVDIFTLDKLPDSMIVLGGGPIGVEMGQSFSRLGSKVTIIQHGCCILPKEDKDVSDCILGLLEKEGLNIVLESNAKKVEKNGDLIKLTYERNGNDQVVEAECLLIATGRQPNVSDLDLEKTGVEYSPRGIIVNNKLRTSAKNIFAAGDCHGGFLFTHVAEYDAKIAALNAKLPFPILKTDYSNIPWCTFIEPEVASVGLNEAMAKSAGIEHKVYKYDFADVDRAKAEGAKNGFVKILTDNKNKLIGAQIVGIHAGELIHEWVAAINGKIDIGRIEKSIHIYPSLAQINKKVAGSFLSSQNMLTKMMTYFLK